MKVVLSQHRWHIEGCSRSSFLSYSRRCSSAWRNSAMSRSRSSGVVIMPLVRHDPWERRSFFKTVGLLSLAKLLLSSEYGVLNTDSCEVGDDRLIFARLECEPYVYGTLFA